MVIDGLEHLLIDLHGLFPAQFSHPFLLQSLLIVGHDEAAHILLLLGLLDFRAIDGVDGEFLEFFHLGRLHLEDFAVHKAVVALLENAFFHADAQHRVVV